MGTDRGPVCLSVYICMFVANGLFEVNPVHQQKQSSCLKSFSGARTCALILLLGINASICLSLIDCNSKRDYFHFVLYSGLQSLYRPSDLNRNTFFHCIYTSCTKMAFSPQPTPVFAALLLSYTHTNTHNKEQITGNFWSVWRGWTIPYKQWATGYNCSACGAKSLC